jgi:hypothetical protein
MRPARPTLLLGLLVLCLPLAACSRGADPRQWAASVCTVLAPWRTEIDTLASRTQQQMTAATSPAQARENLVRLFGGAQAASERARAGVQRAGVPDADHGPEVARTFAAALSAMRDAYGRARDAIGALAVSPAASFYAGVTAVVATLNTQYRQSAPDTTRLESKQLRAAFDEVPECR